IREIRGYFPRFTCIEPLEIKSKLRLHLPKRGFGLRIDAGDQTKVDVVDIRDEPCRIRLGMIEHIPCVHTKLQALGLANLERLAQSCVKPPPSRPFHHTLAQCPSRSRKWILKKNLAGRGVCNSVEGARSPKVL